MTADRLAALREDAALQWNIAKSKEDKAYHRGRMTALADVAAGVTLDPSPDITSIDAPDNANAATVNANDTDRLAALLNEALRGYDVDRESASRELAARLIAAGVTLDPRPARCVCSHLWTDHTTWCDSDGCPCRVTLDPRPGLFTDEEVPRDVMAQVDEWLALTDPPEIAALNVRGFASWLDIRRKHRAALGAPDSLADALNTHHAPYTTCPICRYTQDYLAVSPLRATLVANLDEAELEAAYAKKIGQPGYAADHLDGMIRRLRDALAGVAAAPLDVERLMEAMERCGLSLGQLSRYAAIAREYAALDANPVSPRNGIDPVAEALLIAAYRVTLDPRAAGLHHHDVNGVALWFDANGQIVGGPEDD